MLLGLLNDCDVSMPLRFVVHSHSSQLEVAAANAFHYSDLAGLVVNGWLLRFKFALNSYKAMMSTKLILITHHMLFRHLIDTRF